MGLLFLSDERENLLAMIEEIAEGVEDLGLSDAQCLGDLQDRLALPVQRDHVTNAHAQPVDYRLTAADAFESDNVRMLGLDHLGHALASVEKNLDLSPV